jgi:hypothetical protein
MRRYLALCLTILCASLLLSACSAAGKEDPAGKAVLNYLQAIVTGNSDQLSNTSCKDWESEAMLEMDSFAGVTAKLDDAVCKSTSTNGNSAEVQCTGKISATYNNEQQEFDLGGRTYVVNQVSGDWLVCGYK